MNTTPKTEVGIHSVIRETELAGRTLISRNLGRIRYDEAMTEQGSYRDQCAVGTTPGVLLLLEHDSVITLGVKASSSSNVVANLEALKSLGVAIANTDRGGDVTYHGPGQLVGYPIFKLRDLGGDLHGYLRRLEQVIIDVLVDFNLVGRRNGPAGVWVGQKKICSIGVAVRKMITYHGFALNVDPDMSHFALINPCGLSSEQMTSMAELLGTVPDMACVRESCVWHFADVFGFDSCEVV